jgi:hypothetical protein
LKRRKYKIGKNLRPDAAVIPEGVEAMSDIREIVREAIEGTEALRAKSWSFLYRCMTD